MLRRRFGIALAAILPLAAAIVAGCGKNRLYLDVDVRSFMRQEDLTNDYQSPALLPLEIRLDPISVNLVEGFQDFGTAEEVAIDVTLTYDNASGTGRGTFTLYFDGDASTTFNSPPVAYLEADLRPGIVSQSQARIVADARLLDLFTTKQLWMGVELQWQPTSGETLQGTCDITQLDAHIVSQLDLF